MQILFVARIVLKVINTSDSSGAEPPYFIRNDKNRFSSIGSGSLICGLMDRGGDITPSLDHSDLWPLWMTFPCLASNPAQLIIDMLHRLVQERRNLHPPKPFPSTRAKHKAKSSYPLWLTWEACTSVNRQIAYHRITELIYQNRCLYINSCPNESIP